MRCVVTGGGGFIGSHLVSELVCWELDVVSFDIHPQAPRSVDKHLAVIQGDIRDLAHLIHGGHQSPVRLHYIAMV